MIADLMDMHDRAALVTGGAGHIGRVAAEVLAELGASVAIIDVDERAAREVATDLGSRYDGDCRAIACDLGDEHAARKAIRSAASEFGRLDSVILAAALVGDADLKGWSEPFDEQTGATWRRALDVNLSANFYVVQEARTHLTRSDVAGVVAVGSTYGVLGPDLALYEGTEMGSPAAYAASKGGLLQLVRYLATVLAPEIRVNAISPGGVFRQQPEAFVERYAARTPLRRMATEDDLRGAIVFLATRLSAYVTGQNLLVDGGWTAW